MLKLMVLDSCDDCGRCEVFLPNLLDYLEDEPVMVNPNNSNLPKREINLALKSCKSRSLRLVNSDGEGVDGL